MSIVITGSNMNLEFFLLVARFNECVEISKEAEVRINEAERKVHEILKSGKSVYGINTGFGKLCNVVIPDEELSLLQHNLIRSHACAVGHHLDIEVVRGMMLLRVNALAKGYSGIRLKVLNQIVLYLNNFITPAIPEQGSLGASGDLAPLSHMALTLIGEGEVYYKNELMETKTALEKAGLTPIDKLAAKEGLSLINGTQAMAAIGAITLADAISLIKQADIIGSLSLEALRGVREAFSEQVHNARGQLGQIASSENIRKITSGSTYLSNQGELRVQDAYSLRCMPQVHGASIDALNYVLSKLEIEMNAATDNPLIFDDLEVISGGNFHGQVLALSFDFLKIAISEIASISERRIERLVNPALSEGLPAFLVANPGINSGFMIVQYSAASLVSENKILAHPASVDSIPSSANQEDHVSMGTTAARGARDILRNAQYVLAMELFTSLQAIDLREKLKLGKGTKVVYDYARGLIPFIDNDTIMYPHINISKDIVKSNKLVELVEKEIGCLGGIYETK